MVARRGEEPRVRRHRHRPGAVRRRARRAATPTARVGDDTRRALALAGVRAAPPRTTPRSSRGSTGRRGAAAAHRPRARAHRRGSCATARTRTSTARATAPRGTTSWWDGVEQHAGLALSYLNLYDADAAWRLVHDLGDQRRPCAIIKHANPCGVAVAGDLATAYQRALECDERSAFGGIVALNRPVDAATVERMVAGPQADVVIAPGYDAGHDRGAAREAQEHPPARGAGRPSADRPRLPPDHAAGSSCRTPHHFAAGTRRLAGRHQARAHRRPSGATPSWRGASAAT